MHTHKLGLAFGLALLGLAGACGDDDGTPGVDGGGPIIDADPLAPDAPPGTPDAMPINCNPVQGVPTLDLEDLASGLDGPVAAVVPPGDDRIFVVEKSARKISIFKNGAILPTPFLDASDVVISNTFQSERGLLGLAFNKDYATNGRFYIYYSATGTGAVTLAEYHVSAGNPDVADPTGIVLLSIAHDQASNQTGGWLATGPDGMLYMGTGDGGGSGDSTHHSRDKMALLSKIMRLDVSAAGTYTVPADNPFVGDASFRPEIFAWGVRNPWRNSFDRQTGDLYIGDVGQDAVEEVDVLPHGTSGQDLGWNIMEGDTCFNAGTCNMAGLTQPIYTYTHNGAQSAITGGFVYRGCKMPALSGTYFFADTNKAFIRSLKWDGAGGATDVTDYAQFNGHVIYGFGEDAQGELLLLDGVEGHMYRLVPAP